MPKGRLIVIEGTDGSGKNTQARLLTDALSGPDKPAKLISFPTYGTYSATMVEAYLAGKFGLDPESVNPKAASLFYAMDRYASFHDRTVPGSWGAMYDEGANIVADRYVTSNIVHQMEKLAKNAERAEFIRWLEETEYGILGLPRPDKVFFLHMPADVAWKLMEERAESDPSHKTDIHEKDRTFMERSLEAGLWAARFLGWTIVDCAVDGQPLSRAEIHHKILLGLS